MFFLKKTLFLIFTIILLFSSLYATILNVPGTYSTIQDAIYYSLDADTVLVQPGVYYENIDYDGKLITIGSLFLTTQDEAYIPSTIIDGSSNGSVVTIINGEDETTVLSGFTITNGNLTDGGGIKVEDSSPTLMNLIIIGNSSWSGGGIYLNNSNSFLENLTISGNVSNHSGGGIDCVNSNFILQNSKITNNIDTAGGGTYGDGGGIRFHYCSPILKNVTISGNTANWGGGIHCFKSDTILENVTMSDNTGREAGGGMYIFSENNTNNILNSILWNNSPEEIYAYYDTTTVAYSNIDGGYAGIVNNEGTINWPTGNINANPLFVNPSIRDYHLQPLSPCIDAGDPDPQYNDPDGTRVDMGALYFNQAPVADFTADAAFGLPPLTVNFTDLSTQGNSVIDEWYWDFGDGNNSTSQNPTNEYEDLGTYTVSLTVTNLYGFTDTITKENYITVSAEVYSGPVWHISTTGNDITGNGSEEYPFATIQHGIDVSTETDTVLVQPGTYVENVEFDGDLITVGSLFLTTQNSSYISSTIIDGNNDPGVVSFGNVNSSAVLTGFTITNSSGGNYGGGINCYVASPTLENLIIRDNAVSLYGGGINCYVSNPILKNVTIVDNSAAYGGGIFCELSDPILENVTINGNSASDGGGAIFCHDDSNPSLLNCIIWDDSPPEIAFHMLGGFNSIEIAYSDIDNGEAGINTNDNGTVYWMEGNFDMDPLFVDTSIGNYNLNEDSPCIDAGDPDSQYDDPDGTISDMGAWFYNQGSALNDNEIQNITSNLSNYPNPFNPTTTIQFDIKEFETGLITIYNIKGQLVESHQFDAGEHNFQWNATNQASGVYLYKLQTESTTVNKKMLLLK